MKHERRAVTLAALALSLHSPRLGSCTGDQLVTGLRITAPPSATSEEDRVSFVLAQLRCGALRARHLACEVDAIGIALRGGMIPPDTAVAWLRDCGVLDDVASPQVNTAMSACETCGNNPCVNPSFCAASRKTDREIGQRRLPPGIPAEWDTMSLDGLCSTLNRPRATPRSTIEAVMHSVRERGLAALKEAANLERLQRCDDRAKAQINARIPRVIEKKALSYDP